MAYSDKCYKILNDYAIISSRNDRAGGICYLTLRKISWFGKKESIDLRWWSQMDEPMKGVTMSMKDVLKLKEVLSELTDEQLNGYRDEDREE